MGFKLKSSGLPFKELGSSPAKQETGKKVKLKDAARTGGLGKGLDIKGYLKGEQGYIPDYKGNSTKKTVNKIARKVVKATTDKPKATNTGASEAISEKVTRKLPQLQWKSDKKPKAGRIPPKTTTTPERKKILRDAMRPAVKGGKMLGQKKGKLVKDSIKKVARPSKKSTITDNKSMKPPYKKPVGPRA